MGRHRLLIFLLLSSIFFLIAHRANAAALCRKSDQLALSTLRKTLNFNTVSDNCNEDRDWDASTDCCSWNGIKCHNTTGAVLQVLIVFCFTGTPSTFSPNSSLFHLSSLQSLQIVYSDLQLSAIPNEIANLRQLQTLEITHSNLSGFIPDAIGKLSRLRKLDLSLNKFSGGIPLSLSNLQNLQILNLMSCDLTGTIPPSLFRNSKLVDVDLRDNHLAGSFPSILSGPPNLTLLQISNNDLVGEIPSWLSAIPSLKQLDLSHNKLVGKIPSKLFSIPSLAALDLSNNHLGPLEPFPKPTRTSLQNLDLSFNNISGPFPSSLLLLANVTYLNLEAAQLTGVVEWNTFKNMANLKTAILSGNRALRLTNAVGSPINLPPFRFLYMKSCGLTEFPHFLSKLEALEDLDVSDNGIKGTLLMQNGWTNLRRLNGSGNQIAAFTFPNTPIKWVDLSNNVIGGPLPKPPSSLEILSLANNRFSGKIPSPYCNLSNVYVLDVGHNDLAGALPPCLPAASKNLRVLGLQNNRFSGIVPNTFDCPFTSYSLSFVLLGNNNFEGPLPNSLENCSNLVALDVGNNKITDEFPSWANQLQILVLSANHFHGGVGGDFFSLQILDVASNNLTGNISAELLDSLRYMKGSYAPMPIDYVGDYPQYYWGADGIAPYKFYVSIKGRKLKNSLTILDFSDNKFFGQIPATIGDLTSLSVLTLWRNRLSGEIPTTVGDMVGLESLDLSDNKLGGGIPPNLMSLKRLDYLNLSYNDLVGPIPKGKFPAESYVGNPRLCGPPLKVSC